MVLMGLREDAENFTYMACSSEKLDRPKSHHVIPHIFSIPMCCNGISHTQARIKHLAATAISIYHPAKNLERYNGKKNKNPPLPVKAANLSPYVTTRKEGSLQPLSKSLKAGLKVPTFTKLTGAEDPEYHTIRISVLRQPQEPSCSKPYLLIRARYVKAKISLRSLGLRLRFPCLSSAALWEGE